VGGRRIVPVRCEMFDSVQVMRSFRNKNLQMRRFEKGPSLALRKMGLVRAWRRQIYGASLVAVLIPAAIIAALFVATGGGPLHGLGTLGQVFSGPAIPGGNLSARVSENSKPALPGSGGAGAAALQGHSPVLGQAAAGGSAVVRGSAGPHGSAVAPLHLGTTTPSPPGNGGQLHGGSGLGSGNNPNPTPRPPANPPPTTPTTATSTTTTDSTTAASLPPIVAIPPSPVTTTTPTTATTTTTTTTPVRTTTTSTTRTTTTSTTKTTTTSTTKTTTTPTTKTTTTPTTKTTTTTVTHTTTVKAPTTKTGTHPINSVTPTVATTVAQAERGSAIFTGCTGDWGVAPSGHIE
jgi:hypothetical protein